MILSLDLTDEDLATAIAATQEDDRSKYDDVVRLFAMVDEKIADSEFTELVALNFMARFMKDREVRGYNH